MHVGKIYSSNAKQSKSMIGWSLAAVAINYGVDCSNKQQETKVISLSKYALATECLRFSLVGNATDRQVINSQRAPVAIANDLKILREKLHQGLNG